MYLITLPKEREQLIKDLAHRFGCERYSPTTLSVDKPSLVGEIARYICKVGVAFEVQPWE